MSIFEYDKEKEEKKLRKAEYEHGLEEGITIGKEAGRQEGISIGKEAGVAELITKMYKNGFTVEQISTAIDKSVEEIKEILNRDAI